MRRSYGNSLPPTASLPTAFRAHHRCMKQGNSVEAFYALVFAVCCLVALLMLSS
jgi:hypothetical protein